MTEILREQARKFSNLYFDGYLNSHIDRLTFKVSNRMSKTRGCFSASLTTPTIKLSGLVIKYPCEWKRTLLHELIHYYQFIKYGTCNHSTTFLVKCRDIYIKSDGRYNIKRLSSGLDKEYVKEVSKKRLKNNTQLYVIKDSLNQFNFLRNLSAADISDLKRINRIVYKYTGVEPLRVRCNRNVSAYLNSKYYYNISVFQKYKESFTKV